MTRALEHIPVYPYAFNSGPVPEERLAEPVADGNCRLALQLYFYVAKHRYFPPDKLLNPNGYYNTGTFLKQGQTWSQPIDFFDNLPEGAVVYAEKTTDKAGKSADYSPRAFSSYDDYIIRLHTAVYIRNLANVVPLLAPEVPIVDAQEGQPAILHASSVQSTLAVWSLQKFLQHYKPVAAKQF